MHDPDSMPDRDAQDNPRGTDPVLRGEWFRCDGTWWYTTGPLPDGVRVALLEEQGRREQTARIAQHIAATASDRRQKRLAWEAAAMASPTHGAHYYPSKI